MKNPSPNPRRRRDRPTPTPAFRSPLGRDAAPAYPRAGPSPRVVVHAALLVVGLVGTALALWSMRDATESARAVARLGLQRVANRWHDVLELLAVPLLMFCAVLALWSGFELYRLRRASFDRFGAVRPRRGGRVGPVSRSGARDVPGGTGRGGRNAPRSRGPR